MDYHTGETVVVVRRRKRRREIAELLEALLEKHPTGRVYVAWDNSNTHEDDEVEAVLRGAAGKADPALPADLQSVAEPHRDALAPLQAGGDPLRAVREREGARGGGL